MTTTRKVSADVTPSKKLKTGSGRGIAKILDEEDESDDDDIKERKSNSKASGRGRGGRVGKTVPGAQKRMVVGESDEDADDKDNQSVKSGGRGRGGRGASTAPSGGRGRGGGGRAGFMNFGERKDPPHKGEKVQKLKFLNCFV